jgi:hypothetical protein
MKKIPKNPLNTEKQKLRFKKQVIVAVSDYLKYILSDFTDMHTKLSKKLGRKKLKN